MMTTDARPVRPPAPAGRAPQDVPLVAGRHRRRRRARRSDVKLLIGNSNVEIGQDLAKALLAEDPGEREGRDRDRHRHARPAGARAAQPGLQGGHEEGAPGREVPRRSTPSRARRDNFNTWSAQVKAHPDALAYVGPGSQAAVSLARIQQRDRRKKLLVGALRPRPGRAAGRQGRLRRRRSSRPEHWLKGYLAIKLLADAKHGRQGAAGGRVELRRADRQQRQHRRDHRPPAERAATRTAYFKDEVDKQLANPTAYLQPMPGGVGSPVLEAAGHREVLRRRRRARRRGLHGPRRLGARAAGRERRRASRRWSRSSPARVRPDAGDVRLDGRRSRSPARPRRRATASRSSRRSSTCSPTSTCSRTCSRCASRGAGRSSRARRDGRARAAGARRARPRRAAAHAGRRAVARPAPARRDRQGAASPTRAC